MACRFCTHTAFFIVFVLILVGSLSGCSSSDSVRTPERVGAVKNLSNNDLMVIYGAALRSGFQNQDDIISSNRILSEVEREAERRNLVDNDNVGEIEQGLMYLDMPTHQVFASIDGLKVEEHADFENFVVSLYRGNKDLEAGDFAQGALSLANIFFDLNVNNVDVLDQKSKKTHRETVLICKNKIGGLPRVIGYEVLGTYTFKQYTTNRRRFRKIITNYAPGHFDKRSPESTKYYESGQTPPEKPDKMIQETSGRNHSLLQAVTSSPKGGRLQTYFDDVATSSGYPSLLKYLESAC